MNEFAIYRYLQRARTSSTVTRRSDVTGLGGIIPSTLADIIHDEWIRNVLK